LHHFNQTAAISSTTKSLIKAAAENEQHPKSSKSIDEESQHKQQAKSSPETTEEEQQKQQNETDEPQHLQLAKASIAIGPNRNVEIEFKQGAHGHKIIHIIRFIIRKKTLKILPLGNSTVNYIFIFTSYSFITNSLVSVIVIDYME
jgi:hypothetical protein